MILGRDLGSKLAIVQIILNSIVRYIAGIEIDILSHCIREYSLIRQISIRIPSTQAVGTSIHCLCCEKIR